MIIVLGFCALVRLAENIANIAVPRSSHPVGFKVGEASQQERREFQRGEIGQNLNFVVILPITMGKKWYKYECNFDGR